MRIFDFGYAENGFVWAGVDYRTVQESLDVMRDAALESGEECRGVLPVPWPWSSSGREVQTRTYRVVPDCAALGIKIYVRDPDHLGGGLGWCILDVDPQTFRILEIEEAAERSRKFSPR